MLPGTIKRGRLPEPNEASEGGSESRGGERGAVSSHLRHDLAKKPRSPEKEVYVISHFHYEEVCGRSRKERIEEGRRE